MPHIHTPFLCMPEGEQASFSPFTRNTHNNTFQMGQMKFCIHVKDVSSFLLQKASLEKHYTDHCPSPMHVKAIEVSHTRLTVQVQ